MEKQVGNILIGNIKKHVNLPKYRKQDAFEDAKEKGGQRCNVENEQVIQQNKRNMKSNNPSHKERNKTTNNMQGETIFHKPLKMGGTKGENPQRQKQQLKQKTTHTLQQEVWKGLNIITTNSKHREWLEGCQVGTLKDMSNSDKLDEECFVGGGGDKAEAPQR